MQEMLHLLTETANELLRAFKSETYQVNYDVGFQLEDALTEHAGGVLSRPVRNHLLCETPGGMGFIRFTPGTRNIDHFVLGPDETRHQVRSDVSTSSNDDNAHPCSPRATCGDWLLMSSIVSIPVSQLCQERREHRDGRIHSASET
jgi:hypothetical protein